MLEVELVAESENNKQAKQTHIRLKTKINSNKGKPHLKISDTLLIFYLWLKNINLEVISWFSNQTLIIRTYRIINLHLGQFIIYM